MSLKYEPASEPLYIPVKYSFFNLPNMTASQQVEGMDETPDRDAGIAGCSIEREREVPRGEREREKARDRDSVCVCVRERE